MYLNYYEKNNAFVTAQKLQSCRLNDDTVTMLDIFLPIFTRLVAGVGVGRYSPSNSSDPFECRWPCRGKSKRSFRRQARTWPRTPVGQCPRGCRTEPGGCWWPAPLSWTRSPRRWPRRIQRWSLYSGIGRRSQPTLAPSSC